MMFKAHDIMRYMVVAIMLLPAFVVSCSQVDYDYVEGSEDVHIDPSISAVRFGFDWKNIKDTASVPAQMTVAMSRVVNTVHYVYNLSKDGSILDTLQTGAVQGHQPDTIMNGDYYVLGLARGNARYDYEIPNIELFEDSLSISMKDLYARIPEVPKEELVSSDIVDFNPLYPFVYSAEPLYFEVKKQPVYPADIPTEIVLTPQKLTRELTFKINLSTEKGVKIERLVGIISGVPSEVQLMSGVVSELNTSKVFFDMNEAFSSGNEYIYQGKVNVLGLFPATKPGFITGPGIFQVILHVSIGEGEEAIKRIFYASINIKSIIEKADLMIETTDHLGFRSTRDAMLEIGTRLKVTRNQIESVGEEGQEEWVEHEEDIEVEV